MSKELSVFETLNKINVNEHTEKKAGLTYLSWAWAWQKAKENYPEATYTIYENADGLFYHTDGKTAWVKTGVTINGIEHIEYLPIMDYKNRSIPLESLTSFDVNKAIQRSLTKAVARHGLGLYIYAGEDLPDGEQTEDGEQAEDEKTADKLDKELKKAITEAQKKTLKDLCDVYKLDYKEVWKKTGSAKDMSQEHYGKAMAMLKEHADANPPA